MAVASPLRTDPEEPRHRRTAVRQLRHSSLAVRTCNRVGNAIGGTDTRSFCNQNRPPEMNSSRVTPEPPCTITTIQRFFDSLQAISTQVVTIHDCL